MQGIDAKASPFCVLPERMKRMNKVWQKNRMELFRELNCSEEGLTAAEAAGFYGWTVVPCARDGVLRSIVEIHEEIYAHVKKCMEG